MTPSDQSDDDLFLARLLEDPVTAKLLLAWRRTVLELRAAEESVRAAGDNIDGWEVCARHDDEPENGYS